MKANELMIGDWFVCSDPHPFKVVSIEFDDPYYRVWGNDGFPVDLGDLDPISLTEDILKANGFHKEECYDDANKEKYFQFTLYEDWGRMLYVPSWRAFYLVSNNFHVQVFLEYVHELQHALRLCGLNELADNFKIN